MELAALVSVKRLSPEETREVSGRIREAFEYDGRSVAGVVNRIARRATVLVEDPAGQPYSDGKRYLKFLVPLGRLRKQT